MVDLTVLIQLKSTSAQSTNLNAFRKARVNNGAPTRRTTARKHLSRCSEEAKQTPLALPQRDNVLGLVLPEVQDLTDSPDQ